MDEAQALADRVAVIVAGEIVAIGPPAELGGRENAPARIRFMLPEHVVLPSLTALEGEPKRSAGHVELHTHASRETLHELTGWALAEGHALTGLGVSMPSLEDVYLELTAQPGEVTR
jgi:ABC-2 type transport system ATP-binding protein